jgi:hypothetical protein
MKPNWDACTFSGGEGIGQVATIGCVPYIFESLIYWALVFAGIVALIFIILGGIKLITSSGDSKQVDGARKTITWAIIGLTLVLMSFAIVRFVSAITGVRCITEFGFNICGYDPGQGRGDCRVNPNQPGC